MALRAGYYGLKGSLKKAVEKLLSDTAGMKIIKTIGDGLQLTSAGKLNVTAATSSKIGGIKVGDGLSIDDGVLNVDSVGFDFSTTAFDTGFKWIDGKKIYGKVFNNVTIPQNAFTLSLTIGTAAEVEKIIYFNLSEGLSSAVRCMDYRLYATVEVVDTDIVIKPTNASRSMIGVDVVVFFTVNEAEEE